MDYEEKCPRCGSQEIKLVGENKFKCEDCGANIQLIVTDGE